MKESIANLIYVLYYILSYEVSKADGISEKDLVYIKSKVRLCLSGIIRSNGKSIKIAMLKSHRPQIDDNNPLMDSAALINQVIPEEATTLLTDMSTERQEINCNNSLIN